jgi:hypothetical protein
MGIKHSICTPENILVSGMANRGDNPLSKGDNSQTYPHCSNGNIDRWVTIPNYIVNHDSIVQSVTSMRALNSNPCIINKHEITLFMKTMY